MKLEKFFSTVSIIASILAILFTVFSAKTLFEKNIPLSSKKYDLQELKKENELQKIQLIDVSNKLTGLAQTMERLKEFDNKLTGLASRSGLSKEWKMGLQSTELYSVHTDISEIKLRLTKIEEAILDNPSKVLSIRLVQKDIENLRQSYEKDMVERKEEISRIYDSNKWFIGLMITMTIGLSGLAISSLLHGKKKE